MTAPLAALATDRCRLRAPNVSCELAHGPLCITYDLSLGPRSHFGPLVRTSVLDGGMPGLTSHYSPRNGCGLRKAARLPRNDGLTSRWQPGRPHSSARPTSRTRNIARQSKPQDRFSKSSFTVDLGLCDEREKTSAWSSNISTPDDFSGSILLFTCGGLYTTGFMPHQAARARPPQLRGRRDRASHPICGRSLPSSPPSCRRCR